jgi:hypothetical protein
MAWYWWTWFAVVIFVILLPLWWGMSYRRWGPPYPRYYVRRRVRVRPPSTRRGGANRATEVEVVEPAPEEPEAPSGWGVAADIFWLGVLAALVWAIVVLAS